MEGTSGHMFPLEWLFAKATIAGSSVSSNTAKKQRNIGETWRKNLTEWPLHSWPCNHFKKSWSIFLCWTPEIYFRINYLRNGEYVRSKVSKSLIPSNSIYLHLGHITCSICGLPGVLDQNNWPNWRTSDWFDAAGVRSGVHARGGAGKMCGARFFVVFTTIGLVIQVTAPETVTFYTYLIWSYPQSPEILKAEIRKFYFL